MIEALRAMMKIRAFPPQQNLDLTGRVARQGLQPQQPTLVVPRSHRLHRASSFLMVAEGM